MCRKIISTVVTILAVNLLCVTLVPAQNRNLSSDEAKAQISKLGTGPKARVDVKLRDGTKLTGYVSERQDDYFIVTDAKTGNATKVAYAEVIQVKARKNSSGAKILIRGLALLAGVIAVIVIGGRSVAQ
jgi:hypothetical protein